MKFSATSMKTYDNCPRLFKAQYLDRLIAYVPNAAAERGVAIHAKLEDAVRTGTPPDDVWTPPGLVQTLYKSKAAVEVEAAVTRGWEPVEWHDERVWLRGKLDVLIERPGRSLVLDWKTGKVRPDKIQADVYTALVSNRAVLPGEHEVEFRLVYVDQKQVVPLNRDAEAWMRVRERINQIETDKTFEARPSWLCRYCGYRACRHNTNPDLEE